MLGSGGSLSGLTKVRDPEKYFPALEAITAGTAIWPLWYDLGAEARHYQDKSKRSCHHEPHGARSCARQ